ncbi:MAG: hypothetical protein B7Z08_09260 [Sphingomonadales bacterium 32-68-7]|nr:MAG: hypothetical protein B7Z33_11895 [Sphingomonadales bacterium 12-68-11]OYX08485.1 MAG: hypothetical protein B7Z08_09260 [Sphingomonadales bacterium 32-68-7]
MHRKLIGIAGVALALGLAGTAHAQFGNLGRALGEVTRAVPMPDFLSGPQPVSTSIRDAEWADPSRDGFRPGQAEPLDGLPQNEDGAFVLAAGYYAMQAQSYCLHAGTHGPGGGDGYLYAPVKGSARDAVIAILQNVNDHPEIAQRDVQLLLWAIVARAKFEDLDNRLKLVASQLLTPRQLATLNRNALSMLTSGELSRITGPLPAPLRAVVEAESRLRGMLTSGGSSFAEMERVAVLAGMAPTGPGSIGVPAARWSEHPDGYWVRYTPSGYSNTKVEIYVEPGSAAVGKVYDPATAIAVPGNTARQRLAQSARVYGR